MTSQSSIVVEPEETISEDKSEPKRVGVVSKVFCRISQFWPFRFAMRAFRGFWWLFGFSTPEKPLAPAEDQAVVRPCRAGRKRLWRATRKLLAFLPCRVQAALGYPVCTQIGLTVSPEVQYSPTKPRGKGSKRKQDDVNAEEDEEDDDNDEQQSWVKALSQQLSDEDAPAPDDPDYEPSGIVTDSEEYCSHNNTESDLEVEKGVVVIRDVETGLATSDS